MNKKITHNLSHLAVKEEHSPGREILEQPSFYRSEFQRDRDRIVNSSYFRRLAGKTQVITIPEDDEIRTRLTHSIEVAQIAKTIARTLNLNEDLAETLALAHDIGHPPFGHTGQDILDDLMKDYGGFEHNIQAFRIINELDDSQGTHNGLNLMFETREGILKHCTQKQAQEVGSAAVNIIKRLNPTLEAQIVDYSDSIAYNHHDLVDGIRSGFLKIEDFLSIPKFNQIYNEVKLDTSIQPDKIVKETVKRLKGEFVTDIVESTVKRIKEHNIKSIDDVRNYKDSHNNPAKLVGFSDEMRHVHAAMKKLLHRHFYSDVNITMVRNDAKDIIKELFTTYMNNPELIPHRHYTINKFESETQKARAVSDYISGMTDQYAYITYDNIVKNQNTKSQKISTKRCMN